MRIFVSYTTRDTVISHGLLLCVSEQLRSLGVPFIDIIHNDSLDRQFRVEQELNSADILLLLNSSSIKDSKWVNWEINRARNLGIPIIQIPINDCVNHEQLGRIIADKLNNER